MRIWDTFMYNGERDALAARLALPNIHRRVVVEALVTHSGRRKEKLFFDWSLPGVELVVADLSAHSTPWGRENAQRNAILQGLTEADDRDIVLVSDCDEVASVDGISRGIEALQQHPAVVLCQTLYNYDRKWTDPRGWRGTIVTTAGHLRLMTPQKLRDERENLPRIENAGEHMSWWGGPEEVSRKLASFAHTEYSGVSMDEVRRRMAAGEDLFGRWRLEGPRS